MIVTPEFLDHWKTRLLVDLTKDPTAPLAVIRLWGYCQTSKSSFFTGMTPGQLASICHWGDRQPACHVALSKAGFIEKLNPKGFAAHQWNEYNAKLLANWENGQKGGRPRKEENTNENGQIEKPMGSVGLTQPKPIDRTGLDQIDQKERTGQTSMIEVMASEPKGASCGPSPSPLFSKIRSDLCPSPSPNLTEALVNGLARAATSSCYPIGGEPTLEQVRRVMESKCKGSGRYAEKWLTATKNRLWKDHKQQPITHWQPLAESFANACVCKDLGVSSK
jgi:hypothetical protein